MASTPDVTAILDVYSGRENPVATLPAASVDELHARLADLSAANPTDPPGLGYRGVVVIEQGDGTTAPREIRAHHGVVTITSESSTEYYRDVSGIEAVLLRDVARFGGVDTLREIASLELDALLRAVSGVGPGRSLASKVGAAQADLKRGNVRGACGVLQAFIEEVRAQSRQRAIDGPLAAKLTDDATRVRAMIGCS